MKSHEALLVIDVQNFFVDEHMKDLPGKLNKFIQEHHSEFDLIVFTQFINDPNASVFKIRGWEKCTDAPDTDIASELEPSLKYGHVVPKNVYSAFEVPLVTKLLRQHNITKITLCGIDTDTCVLSTGYDALDHGYNVQLLENLSGSHGGPQLHNAAVTIFQRSIGPTITK